MLHRSAIANFVLLFAMIFFPATRALAEDAVRASMVELEGLAVQARWAEALLRVDDIAVGQRDDRWRKLVTRIVIGHLSQLASETSAGRDGVALELGRRYPFLAQSEEFRRRRDDAILSTYRDCTAIEAKGLDCSQRLSQRLTETGDDTSLVGRAAKEVEQLQGREAAESFLRIKFERLPSSSKDRLRKAPELRHLLVPKGM